MKISNLAVAAFLISAACGSSPPLMYPSATAQPEIPTAQVQITWTPEPTRTLAPSKTITETFLPLITHTQTLEITATQTITPTETLIPPTVTAVPIPTDTQPPPAPVAVCDCSRDYNCSDFTSHSKAQTCFNSCGGSKSNNWSRLDGNDGDGNVCESLP